MQDTDLRMRAVNKKTSWLQRTAIAIFLAIIMPLAANAQIGEHRSELSVGVNGGYMLSNVGFNPDIPQGMLGGLTGGLTVRYTCEKYFKSVCALVGEVNFAQAGWKEDILTVDDQQVINQVTGRPEEFQRTLTYVQVPLFARLGWGRERKGFQFYFQVGPQVGFLLGDKKESNFNFNERNQADRIGALKDAVQDSLDIERKFDYGIAGGLGIEYSHPKVGHFLLEGRYYYGLSDIFGNGKSDVFGRSANGTIIIKASYLFDIIRTKPWLRVSSTRPTYCRSARLTISVISPSGSPLRRRRMMTTFTTSSCNAWAALRSSTKISLS